MASVHASLLFLLVRSFALMAVALSSAAWAEAPASTEQHLAPTPRFNPTTFLRQAIAALLPANAASGVLDRADTAAALDVDFASSDESDRVSLSLADSEVRVRLGEGLRLHCEVSSREELYAAPELGIDLAIRFEFQ